MVGDTTTIWIMAADRPEARSPIAKIHHQTGYGVRANIAPDARRLAYTVLPVDVGTAIERANLWVMNLDGTSPKLVQEGVDLQSAPVWSSDGRKLVFRRSVEAQAGQRRTELWQVEMASGEAKRLVADEEAMGLYPIGWAKEGKKLYYSRITSAGSALWEADEVTAKPSLVLPLSDGIARDLRLSPDGLALSYSHGQPSGSEVQYRVEVVNLAAKTREVMATGRNDHLAPLWRPKGMTLTLSSEPGEVMGQGAVVELGLEARATTVPFAAPANGFDVPLQWSPQGDYLAVKTFQRGSTQAVQSETMAILSTSDGRRIPVSLSGYAEFIGWVMSQ